MSKAFERALSFLEAADKELQMNAPALNGDPTFEGAEDTPALANKGRKPVQMSRVPVEPLKRLAEHFSKGADKYPDVALGVANWSRGLVWSDSYNALQRHLLDWWGGQDLDEDGNRNLDAVMWHAVVLSEYTETHPELDDRPRRKAIT